MSGTGTPDAAEASPSLQWRATFGAALASAMGVGTFMLFALGTLAPFLIEDLGLTRVQFGGLSTALFVVSAILSPVAGALVDALNVRRLALALFAVSMVSFAAVSLAQSYAWLVAAIAFGGIANALANPVTNRLLLSYLPAGRQGILAGVKQSGVQMGSLVAGAALPSLALAAGWRGAFAASLALPLLGGLLMAWTVYGRDSPGPVVALGQVTWRGTLRVDPVVAWLVAFAFFMGAGVVAVSAYLPLYAYEQIDLSRTAAGLALALMGVVGIAGRIAWGRQAERMAAAPTALSALAFFSVASALLILAAGAAGPVLLLLGAIGIGASAVPWNAVGAVVILRGVDGRSAGRASGLMQTGFFTGFIVGPIGFGQVLDSTGSYAAAWAGVAAAFGCAFLVGLAWRRRDRRFRPAAPTPMPDAALSAPSTEERP